MREPTADNDWALHREAVASVLTAVMSQGCEPYGVQYEPGEKERCSHTIKGLVREIFATEVTWVFFERDNQHVGKIMFTPYEHPGEVVCDYGAPSENFFWNILDKWGEYCGY